jgi:hypothetical protein
MTSDSSDTTGALDNLPSTHEDTQNIYRCLILSPTDENATFRRIGFVCFYMPRWFDEQRDPKSTPENVRAQWLIDERALLKSFRSSNIQPEHFEQVDDSKMYTINIV